MNDRVGALMAAITAHLNAMEDVFSTAQWGGRAYKLPGPGGSRTRPKLLAFISVARDGNAVSAFFKLTGEQAADAIERHDWVAPHSFRSLAGSGWVQVSISDKRQLPPLKRLLAASRTLHPTSPSPSVAPSTGAADPVARRIDRVMAEARADGWTPPTGKDFDDDR